jgi:hypothetical protein
MAQFPETQERLSFAGGSMLGAPETGRRPLIRTTQLNMGPVLFLVQNNHRKRRQRRKRQHNLGALAIMDSVIMAAIVVITVVVMVVVMVVVSAILMLVMAIIVATRVARASVASIVMPPIRGKRRRSEG